MVKITDLKEGDIVNVLQDDNERVGTVIEINRADQLACIDNGVQEFWYPPEQIVPIPLTEKQLIETLGFEREETPEGTKYKKGPFRIMVHDPGNYTNLDVWYRGCRAMAREQASAPLGHRGPRGSAVRVARGSSQARRSAGSVAVPSAREATTPAI